MKTSLLALAFALTAMTVLAQPREGKRTELSLSGSYENYSGGNGSGSSGALLVSTRLGFYVVKGLELEPEILAMVASGMDPVYMLNGNVSYNFVSAAKTVPFVLLGYGISNTLPFFNVPTSKFDFTVGVLNIGGGLKFFLTEDVALRVEYRYQHFSGEGTIAGFEFYSFTEKIDVSLHTVQFGLSILL